MKVSVFISTTLLAALAAAPVLADKGGKHGRFAKLDLDGDGSVTKQEFAMHHDAMFDKMDKNADGLLTKDEMRAMIKERRKGRHQHQHKHTD